VSDLFEGLLFGVEAVGGGSAVERDPRPAGARGQGWPPGEE
jgi:hypothetical protein